MNGNGGLSWYSPRVCSTSGNDTPAARTSTSTPLPGVSIVVASGSGTSTSFSASSGPLSSVIWIARKGRRPYPNSSSSTRIARGGARITSRPAIIPIAAANRDSSTGCTTITSRAWSPSPFCTTDLTDTS